jgi:hypothetical protein
MSVALRRCGLRSFTWHSAGAWWYDHGRIGIVRRDLCVNVVPVVRSIADEGRHGTIDLLEQGANLRAVIGTPAGQHRSDTLARVGVCGEVSIFQARRRSLPCFSSNHPPGPNNRSAPAAVFGK